MSGELLRHEKVTDELGNTVETKIWKVPVSGHAPFGYRDSLVYIVDGERVVGFDNGERKGDHRHFMGNEAPYRFRGLPKLVRDFLADVERYKEIHNAD